MANVDSTTLATQTPRTGAYGNVIQIVESLTPAATVNIADVVRILRIPAYFLMTDLSIITNAANASATVSAGYITVDGLTANATYFVAAGASIATAGRVRANAGVTPTSLTQDGYVTITVAGATVSTSTTITVILSGYYLGTP